VRTQCVESPGAIITGCIERGSAMSGHIKRVKARDLHTVRETI
jgi:hypothetical protein